MIDAKLVRAEELEAAFADMGKERPDAVIVQPSLPAKRVAELATKYQIPTVSTLGPFAEQGGLMSYSPVLDYLYRRAAVYVDKILKGAKPGDLPVEQHRPGAVAGSTPGGLENLRADAPAKG